MIMEWSKFIEYFPDENKFDSLRIAFVMIGFA